MKITYALIILAALILIGCKTKKNNTSATNTEPTKQVRDNSNDVLPNGKPYAMLKFSRGMCFGKCPVYNITINSDGTMEYFGKMNVDKLGTYASRMSKGDLANLYTELKAMNLFQYEGEYGGAVMDISQQILTYREDGKEKKIICKLNCPDELSALMIAVDVIATRKEGWKLVEALPDHPANNNNVDNTKYDEVIVHIAKDADINKLARTYGAYNLIVKKSLSINGFIWLLGFNGSKLTGKEMVALLKEDPDVTNAELNKKVTPRKN